MGTLIVKAAVIKMCWAGGMAAAMLFLTWSRPASKADGLYLHQHPMRRRYKKHSTVRTALQIGCTIPKGLGAGADPEVGRQAAMDDRDRIIELIEGYDMLFITAGMGGGAEPAACSGGRAGGQGTRDSDRGRG